jgi:hypothetical protein
MDTILGSSPSNRPRKRGYGRGPQASETVRPTSNVLLKFPSTRTTPHYSSTKNCPFRSKLKIIIVVITIIGIITVSVIISTPPPRKLSPRQALEKTCRCDNDVCNSNANGFFVGSFEFELDKSSDQRTCLSSDDVIRIVMDRISFQLPFAWVRWGDGEIFESTKEGEYSKRLKASLFYLSRNEYAIVNVGMWWLKNQRMTDQWNSVVPPQPQLSESVKTFGNVTNEKTVQEQIQNSFKAKKMIFHNHFYLPMGGPLNLLYKDRGIKGWLYEIEDYSIILVGPSHLVDVPFLNPSVHFESSGVNRNLKKTSDLTSKCKKMMDQQIVEGGGKPLMFLLAAGFSTKIIIADLLQYREESRNHYIQSFIDIGASLDGYVGIHSRDYNSPNHYCAEVLKNDDPRNRYHWMKKGVCEKIYWKDYNSSTSTY